MIASILFILLVIYIVVVWISLMALMLDADFYHALAKALIWPLHVPRVLKTLGKTIIEEIKNV